METPIHSQLASPLRVDPGEERSGQRVFSRLVPRTIKTWKERQDAGRIEEYGERGNEIV